MTPKRFKPIQKNIQAEEVFNGWLSLIDRIEQIMNLCLEDDKKNFDFTFDVAFLMFPLMECISQNLLHCGLRKYLKELGLLENEADVLVEMYRNGLIHYGRHIFLEYDDGRIRCDAMSGIGSGGLPPYDFGFECDNPKISIPAEEFFEYYPVDNTENRAILLIDRTLARVKADLLNRRDNYTGKEIQIIVGKKLDGKRPTPSEKKESAQ